MAKVDGTGSQSEAEVSGVAGQGETGEASHPTDALVSADGGDIAVAAGAEAVPRAEAAESTAAEGGAATGRPGWPLGQALRRVWRGLRQRGAWARKAVLGVRGQRGRNAVADAVVVEETDSRVGPAASEVEVLGGNSALAQHHGDRRSPAGTAQGRADAARAAGVGPPRAGRGGGHGWGSARARRVPAGFDARRLLGGLVAVPEELVVREESKSMHEEAFRIANLVDLGGPEGAPTESGMERGGGAPQSDGVGMAPKRALAHVDSMGGPDGVDDAWGATRGWHRSENGTAGRSLRILEGVPEGGTPEVSCLCGRGAMQCNHGYDNYALHNVKAPSWHLQRHPFPCPRSQGPLFTMASDSARPRRFFNDSAKTRSRPSGPVRAGMLICRSCTSMGRAGVDLSSLASLRPTAGHRVSVGGRCGGSRGAREQHHAGGGATGDAVVVQSQRARAVRGMECRSQRAM